MALITVRDAAFAYDGPVVVSGLDFEVNRGDYLCVVGENGSGKSTLIKGLLGLLRPVSGSVLYGDGLSASQIGYLPQQSQAQRDFPASVWEVVLSGCRICGLFPSARDRQRARENLKLMQIEALQRKSYRELSGGQQQRVLLARALCATESLLLMDEPAAGLDPLVSRELYQLIARLNHEQGITILMISHDVRTAVTQASHILHLDRRPLFFGSRDDYAASALARRFTGGEPA